MRYDMIANAYLFIYLLLKIGFAIPCVYDGAVVYRYTLQSNRYGQEFRQLLARAPDDKSKYKDHETLLSFYTEDVMRAAEREVIGTAFHCIICV